MVCRYWQLHLAMKGVTIPTFVYYLVHSPPLGGYIFLYIGVTLFKDHHLLVNVHQYVECNWSLARSRVKISALSQCCLQHVIPLFLDNWTKFELSNSDCQAMIALGKKPCFLVQTSSILIILSDFGSYYCFFFFRTRVFFLFFLPFSVLFLFFLFYSILFYSFIYSLCLNYISFFCIILLVSLCNMWISFPVELFVPSGLNKWIFFTAFFQATLNPELLPRHLGVWKITQMFRSLLLVFSHLLFSSWGGRVGGQKFRFSCRTRCMLLWMVWDHIFVGVW